MTKLNIIENFKVNTATSSLPIRSTLLQPRVAGLSNARKINDATFQGYEDIIIKPLSAQLTTENLDSIIEEGIEYWAEDDNSCKNKPDSSVLGFALSVKKINTNSILQDLIQNGDKKHWFRVKTEDVWGEWDYFYSVDNPQPTPSLVETATKLQTPRTIEISGLISAKALFDGTNDINLVISEISGIGNDSGVLEVTGNTINFANTDGSVFFGNSIVDGSILPTNYYFGDNGSASIHVSDIYIGSTSINDKFSKLNHNHDEDYSKINHTHEIGDLGLNNVIYTAGLNKEVDDSLVPKN